MKLDNEEEKKVNENLEDDDDLARDEDEDK
jgi:hypothetical protein